MQEIVTIFIAGVVLSLLLLVRNRAEHSKSSLSFQLVLVALGIWAVFNYFSLNSLTQEGTLFWIRAVMAATVFLGLGIYLLGNYFPSNRPIAPKLVTSILVGVSPILAILAAFTDFIVEDVVVTDQISPSFGPLIPLFGIFLFGTVISFTIMTSKKYIRSIGREKQQILYLATGLGLTTSLALITNFVFVVLLKVSDFVVFGPFFALIFAYFTFIAIIRHRLFDIRFLIGRILYYFILTIIPYTLFFGLALLFESTVGSLFDPIVLILGVPIAVVFVILFKGSDDYLKNQIAIRIINPGYRPLELVDRFSSDLSSKLDMEEISSNLFEIIAKSIRPAFTTLVVYDEEDQGKISKIYESDPSRESNSDRIKDLSRLVGILWETVGPRDILEDELEMQISSGIYMNTKNIAKDVMNMMHQSDIKSISPLISKDNVKGAVILGKKESDFPYNLQDIEFLTSVSKTASVAIERSLLYSEVQEFASTLQGKVDDATKELQEANNSLQTTLRQLQEVRRRERDMIDVMGHELRTPMSIVRNALSLLEREYEKNDGDIPRDKLERYIDMGVESAKREVALIETLLSATKIDAARIQLYLTKVDHKDVIHDGIEGQKGMLKEKNLELIYEPPDFDIFTYCDRTRVQQIMDNFLSNSAKYTPEGTITLKIWKDNKASWISITDSGIGIDPEDLLNLGKKFFRAKQYIPKSNGDGQKVVRPGGTGLGLYVTFELIRLMGGQLYINSIVGQGTTFTWSMPMFTGQEEEQIDQTFDTEQVTNNQHVFINQSAPIAS